MKRYFQHEATREKCHIYKMLEEQTARPHHSFHTPGHKVHGYDITELAYSDNLSCPQGVLLQAEREIAELLGADASFLLTDGSTSGVLSMLYALKKKGAVRIAAPLLSHKSFFNGCELLGLTPVLFETPAVALPCPLTAKDVEQALAQADGLFLTSPDYYGNIADLQQIRKLCSAQGKPLVIDGAHGGHLHYHSKIYAGAYADMWVDGVHKSLPVAMVLLVALYLTGQYIAQDNEFASAVSTILAIIAAVAFWMEFRSNERINEAQLIMELNHQFISSEQLSQVE